jgi:hypothetical protein
MVVDHEIVSKNPKDMVEVIDIYITTCLEPSRSSCSFRSDYLKAPSFVIGSSITRRIELNEKHVRTKQTIRCAS